MKNEDFKEMIELFVEFGKVQSQDICKVVDYEYHSGKDYYSVTFEFEYCNRKFSDCLVIYCGDECLNKDALLEDLKVIVNKAKLICD